MPQSVGLRWDQAYLNTAYLGFATSSPPGDFLCDTAGAFAIAYPSTGTGCDLGDVQKAPYAPRGSAADGKLSKEESQVGQVCPSRNNCCIVNSSPRFEHSYSYRLSMRIPYQPAR